MVPLHALAIEGKQQKFALSAGGGARERGRRYGQSAEVSRATKHKYIAQPLSARQFRSTDANLKSNRKR